MKILFHVALDSFGADCLGSVALLLAKTADPKRERHVFVWAGAGEPPVSDDFWSDRYPTWHDRLELSYDPAAHGAQGFDLERGLLARAVADSFVQDRFRTNLRDLFAGWPVKLLGRNVPFESSMILCGSLADPLASGLLLGSLSGLGRLRRLGVSVPATYGVVGIGHRSGPTEGQEEKARALVAAGLLDLQTFFETGTTLDYAPLYLVGEAPIDRVESDRPSQRAVGSITIFALTRSLCSEHALLDPNRFNPFLFSVDSDGTAHFANDVFQPAAPFAAAGAYLVHCPAERLARLMAARVCQEIFGILAKQEPCGTLEDCEKIEPPRELAAFLETVEAGTIRHIWESVFERSEIPFDRTREERQKLAWFDLGRVKLLFEPIFKSREWHRLMEHYGVERLGAIPLQDWNGALTDLVEAIERGYLPHRRQKVATIVQRILRELLAGLDGAVGAVFSRTFHPPVADQPHRAAQVLLGRIHRALREEQIELQKIGLIVRRGGAACSSRRKEADEEREALAEAISSVPSPAAVLLRLAPSFFLGVGIFLGLPFPLGWLDPPPMRLLAGALTGGVLVGALFHRHVLRIRRRLFALFDEWLVTYRAALDEEDAILGDNTYADLIRRMLEVVEWYFEGEADDPPVPRPARVNLESERTSGEAAPLEDLLRPQTVLSDFGRYLKEASVAFGGLEERFLGDFQTSCLETILPEISPSRRDVFEREYARLFAGSRGTGVSLAELLHAVGEWCGRNAAADTRRFLLPFREFPAGERSAVEPWRRSFLVPDGSQLLDEARRNGSSGFLFLDAVIGYLLDSYAQAFDLPARIQEYLQGQRASSIQSTPLSNRHGSLSAPSVPGSAGRFAQYGVAAGLDDILAGSAGWRNDLGARRVSAQLQVKVGLTAQEVIYYPNESSPINPLGLAWKTFKQSPWQGKSFAAVKLHEEPGP